MSLQAMICLWWVLISVLNTHCLLGGGGGRGEDKRKEGRMKLGMKTKKTEYRKEGMMRCPGAVIRSFRP